MFAETDTTAAATRNYEARQTDPPNLTSPPLSAGGYNPAVQETVRFYQPPVAPSYAPYPIETPRKSRAGLWILLAFLSLLIVGCGMVGMVWFALRQHQTAPIPTQENARGIPVPGELPPPPPPPPPLTEKDKSGGDNLTPSDIPRELQRFAYPNAKITSLVNVFNNQVVSMTTDDDIPKIRDFYKKLIGPPMVESQEKSDKSLVFQTSDSPTVMIIVENDKENSGSYSITLTRSPFVPKMN